VNSIATASVFLLRRLWKRQFNFITKKKRIQSNSIGSRRDTHSVVIQFVKGNFTFWIINIRFAG